MKRVTKSALRKAAKGRGLHVLRGSHLVAFRGEDIISGLVIDAPPSGPYLCTFLLPLFDAPRTFLPITLGDRVAACTDNSDGLDEALDAYRATLAGVRDAGQLMRYVEHMDGHYAQWVLFLCYIREKRHADAGKMTALFETGPPANHVVKSYRALSAALRAGGWPAVDALLNKWTQQNQRQVAAVPLGYHLSATKP